MRLLFESGVYFVRRGYRLKKFSEHKHKDSHCQVLSGVRVNIDAGSGSGGTSLERAQLDIALRARGWLRQTSSEDGHVLYITSKMAELPKMLERRDTGEPINVHVRICQRSISSRGDYSRAASISFRACSSAATIRERRLFESGVYSVIYGT